MDDAKDEAGIRALHKELCGFIGVNVLFCRHYIVELTFRNASCDCQLTSVNGATYYLCVLLTPA